MNYSLKICPYLTAKEYLEGYCNFLEVDLAWWDYYVASCAYDGMVGL